MRARLAIFALALLGVASAQPATAANWLEKNFGLWGPQYDAEVPLCEDDRVLSRIQSHFAQKERDYWNSRLQITGWEYIRERAWMPWHYASIPRRFCSGKVHLSDGTVRRIGYVVGEDMGIIGSTWGVEFCVVGLDRNWAYMPACKEVGPSMAPQGGTATYSLPADPQ